jgi:hypothetical protein
MKKLSPNWKATAPIGGQLAILVQEISTSELESKLNEYRALFPKKTPALDTAKSVWLALAIRSFPNPELDYIICADESIEQLGEHLGLDQSDSKTKGRDAISNALRFLEWFGGLRTLRKGGGKLKKPTVREVILSSLSKRETTRSESELSDDLNGNEPDLNGRESDLIGKGSDLIGKGSDLIGSEPVTPSSYQVFTKTPPYINHESEIEISNEEYQDYLSQLESSKHFALEQVKKLGRRKTDFSSE